MIRGPRRQAWFVALAVVVTGLVASLSGCGVRNDGAPRAISPDEIPYDLLDPTTSAALTTTTTPAAAARVSIYLINSDGFLIPVNREVPDPVDIADVLQALFNGPSDREAGDGLRSAIPRTTEVLSTRLDIISRVLTVNLTADPLEISGTEQRLALAQVVYTATALGAVQSVLFRFDGNLTEVPDADGATKSTPLERRDYFKFEAARAATSTTTSTTPPGPSG